MSADSNTTQIGRLGASEHAQLVRARLQQILGVDLSSEVEAKIAQHLDEHGSLTAADTTDLVVLIRAEARRGMARSPIPAVVQTVLVVGAIRGVLALLNIVFPTIWLLLATVPLFVVISRARTSPAQIRRALALTASETHAEPGS